MRIGIHLLGAGSLGTTNAEYPARLAALKGVTGNRRAELLLGVDDEVATRPGHSGRPAVASFLAVAGEVDELWLIATDQRANPAASPSQRALDTKPLAVQVQAALGADPGLFGVRCGSVRKIVVAAVDPNRVARSVATQVRRARAAAVPGTVELVLDAGPGAVGLFVGAYLGCIRGGGAPRLIQTNASIPQEIDVSIDAAGLDRWLVRTGSFDGITSSGLRTDPRVQREAALRRLDWPRARAAEVQMGIATVPPEGARSLAVAGSYEGFVRRSMLARAGLGDRSAEYLFRPWMTASFAARVANDRDFVGLDIGDIDRLLSGFEVDRASEEAVRRTRKARRSIRWATARRHAADALHESGGPTGASVKERVLALLDASPTKERLDLDASGLPDWQLIGGERHLVMLPVGLRFSDAMAGTVAGFVESIATTVLVHSRDTTKQANGVQVAVRSKARKILRVSVGTADHANDLHLVRSKIRKSLMGYPAAREVGRVSVVCAPGTKAMNLAVLAEGLRFATENAVPIEVVWLQELSDGGTQVVREPMDLARAIGSDDLIRQVLRWAVPEGDLATAVSLCALGSVQWSRAGVLASALTELLTRDLVACRHACARLERELQLRIAAPRDVTELWTDRLAFVQRSAFRDPWGAIMAATAIGESTWPPPGGWAQRGRHDTWADPRRFPASYRLWTWRNASPFGHDLWADPRPATEIHEQLANAAAEHRTSPGPGPSCFGKVLAELEAEIARSDQAAS